MSSSLNSSNDLRLSVIIPTYYRYDCLGTMLKMLENQSYKPFEVIICDQTPLDERPDNFYHQFKSLPLKILNLEKPSFSYARNKGAATSAGDIILFLDDDVEFAEDLLEQHVKIMVEENVDVVVGASPRSEKIHEHPEDDDSRQFDPLSYLLKAKRGKWTGMVFGIIGLNTSLRREFFLRAGGFDEKIPRMEDAELGYRLYRSGAKIFRSYKPFVSHKRWSEGGSRKIKTQKSYIRLVSKLYLYKKHFPGWSTRQFIIHEALNALTFRVSLSGYFHLRHFKNPLFPVSALYTLIKAWFKSEKLIRNTHD
jgi:GT2 family glycosyltransferase